MRKWFEIKLAILRCYLYGHLEVKELHRYEVRKIKRSFRGAYLDNLICSKAHTETQFIAKFACRGCNRIFLRKITETVELQT